MVEYRCQERNRIHEGSCLSEALPSNWGAASKKNPGDVHV